MLESPYTGHCSALSSPCNDNGDARYKALLEVVSLEAEGKEKVLRGSPV